jgi:hypothetical protein
MKFNATKCYILSIKQSSSFTYSLNNTFLKQVSSNPYLGINFSQDLKWSDHIAKITKKANSTLGFLRRNLHRCPTSCRRGTYLSLIRSSLEYGSIIWDPYNKKDINTLEQVQRRAARFITGDYRSRKTGCVQRLLTRLKLPTLQDRRQHLRLVYFYKVVEGLVPALPSENFLKPLGSSRLVRSTRNNDFVTTNPIENYTRNNNRCYTIQPCKTDQFRNSFFIRTAIDWNHLDDNTVNSGSLASFRTILSKD